MNAFLGIDTSCYTTSLALLDESGSLLKEQRKALFVEQGKRGLRQSEALFQHIRNLPMLIQEVTREYKILAVCASTKPRPIEGSYMPVFLAGENFGRTISSILDVPFYEFTHQEGHLLAAKYETGLNTKKYLAVHLSGGTTELLLVNEDGIKTRIERLGGSLDVYAGQFIDRVGMYLGLQFPCGKMLTDMALKTKSTLMLPSVVKGLQCSFSGVETKAYALCGEKEEVAYAVLDCIVRTIQKLLENGSRKTGLREVLLFGGVAESQFIRERLKERIVQRRQNIDVYFAKPSFSSDNGLGVALAARKFYTGSTI